MKPNPIEKVKCIGTDNGGLAFTSEMQAWVDGVTDVLNYLLAQNKTEAERLGEFILKFNKEHPHPDNQ